VQLPITIGLHRSRILDVLIFIFALIGSGANLAFSIKPLIQFVLLILVWAVSALAWRQLSTQVSQLRLGRNGEIALLRAGSDVFEAANIMSAATVHPWLTVFYLKTAAGPAYTLIVTVDSLKADNFRRLRVFLRWRADFSVPDDDV
jgi:hypothetical protein